MAPKEREKSKRIYTGKILNLDLDTVRFPDGSTGELEMIRHPGASAVLPFLSDPAGDNPEVLLIRQYRYAAEGDVFEIPAGRLDPGEDPEHCARRELREETGYTAESVQYLTTIFTTPGFTDEKIHLFTASKLTTGKAAHESDEFVSLAPMSLSEALRRIESGEIQDSKTIVALMFAVAF